MPANPQADHLTLTWEVWELGEMIIARLMNIALQQAGSTKRVGSEPVDATGTLYGSFAGN